VLRTLSIRGEQNRGQWYVVMSLLIHYGYRSSMAMIAMARATAHVGGLPVLSPEGYQEGKRCPVCPPS
jgi:hypothetical protein